MKLKNYMSDARAVFLAVSAGILCLCGVLMIFLSFSDYDKTNGLKLHGLIFGALPVSGLISLVAGAGLFFHTRLNYKKGVEIKRGGLSIIIKAAEIQKINNMTPNSAIVLPANTTLLDDCADDNSTVRGAFFCEKFPEEIDSLPSLFKTILDSTGINPASEGQYPPGTTIILPDRFSNPARVLVTVSAIHFPESGIFSNPQIISSCVEGIFRITADQSIDTIYVPVLGSGYGGLERGLALFVLILAILHSSKNYHHIKQVYVVVHPKDTHSLPQIDGYFKKKKLGKHQKPVYTFDKME